MGTHPIFESDFDCLTDMLTIVLLVQAAVAHRMMLSWNCGGGNQGGFTENIPCNNPAKIFAANIEMSDLKLLTAVKSLQTIPKLNFALSGVEAEEVSDLAQLDETIAALVHGGKEVVLLGREFVANRAPEPTTNDELAHDRKIMQSADESASWETAEEKFVPGCGAIKITPTLIFKKDAAADHEVWTIGKSTEWQCADKKWTLAAKKGDESGALEITMQDVAHALLNDTQQYSYWNFTAKFGEVGFVADKFNQISVPMSTYTNPAKTTTWSLTCTNSTMVNLANDGAMLSFGPYQLQMGDLDYYGDKVFSPNYDCTPLMGEMVWVSVIGLLIFTLLLSTGIYFILSIEAPAKFESPRSRPLIIPDN